MQWINNLKIAIIDKDIIKIQKIISDMPKINDLDKAKEALALVKEAISIVEEERTKTIDEMNKIRKTKAFMSNH